MSGKVLIIEDDLELQELLGTALTLEGYEVHHAYDGQEGLGKCLELEPDIVLLDMVMPSLSGLEMLELMRGHKLSEAIPVVAMTGSAHEAEALMSDPEEHGTRGCLRKPFKLAELKNLLRVVLS